MQNVRRFRLFSASMKNYYEELGINKNATQTDIKDAYYKLSKLYHPDKTTGNESAEKFRTITAAYETLGNARLRRMYDRGVGLLDIHETHDEAYSKIVKERQSTERNKPYATSGKKVFYDFDEWSQAHYQSTFNRQKEDRFRHESKRNATTAVNIKETETHIIISIAAVLITFVIMTFTFSNSMDDPSLIRKNKKKDS